MGRQPVRSAPGGGLRTCDSHPDLSFRLRPSGLAHRGASLSQTALNQMLYADMKVWLPENLLLKGDKMTMATAVELRVPFLDHKLLEHVTSLPDSMKVRGNQGKWILRRVMGNVLPPSILHRTKKGFPNPTAS